MQHLTTTENTNAELDVLIAEYNVMTNAASSPTATSDLRQNYLQQAENIALQIQAYTQKNNIDIKRNLTTNPQLINFLAATNSNQQRKITVSDDSISVESRDTNTIDSGHVAIAITATAAGAIAAFYLLVDIIAEAFKTHPVPFSVIALALIGAFALYMIKPTKPTH